MTVFADLPPSACAGDGVGRWVSENNFEQQRIDILYHPEAFAQTHYYYLKLLIIIIKLFYLVSNVERVTSVLGLQNLSFVLYPQNPFSQNLDRPY